MLDRTGKRECGLSLSDWTGRGRALKRVRDGRASQDEENRCRSRDALLLRALRLQETDEECIDQSFHCPVPSRFFRPPLDGVGVAAMFCSRNSRSTNTGPEAGKHRFWRRQIPIFVALGDPGAWHHYGDDLSFSPHKKVEYPLRCLRSPAFHEVLSTQQMSFGNS